MKLIKTAQHYFHILGQIVTNTKDISKQNNYFVIQLKDNSSFYLRNFMDLWTLTETYLNRDYEKNGIKIGSDWTVVDIGAAFGDFSILAAKKSDNNKIIAVEPLPSSLDLLQKNLEINKIKNVKLYCGAISSQKKYLNIFEDSKNFGHSQISNSGQKIKTISLPKLFSRYNVTHCNLIKCDCEGSEYDIFSKLGHNFYKKVDNIVMEYHLFDHKSKYKFKTLQKVFSDNGYYIKITPNPVHSNLGFLFAFK